MSKLNQVLAVEKGIKSNTQSIMTQVYHSFQKPDNLDGFSKVYKKHNEDSADHSPQSKLVRMKATDLLDQAAASIVDLVNITATKDFANTVAKADVVVDGVTLAESVPATHLLFLEKKCRELKELVSQIPTLDSAEVWTKDTNDGLFKSTESLSERTEKVTEAIVLYDATQEHPAQTQLVTKDQFVGTWSTQKHSGALPVTRKRVLAERVEKLSRAVKMAREEANSVEVEQKTFGQNIVDFIFGD